MPVMIFYKDKNIDISVAKAIAESLAKVTKQTLDASIEVRVVEPQYTYNSNEIHVEMRFRDFDEYSDKRLEEYHSIAMETVGQVLKKKGIKCQYSFYIIPTQPPRSMWSQETS